MVATFVVTSDPSYSPPRVLLELNGAAGSTVSIQRNVAGSLDAARYVRGADAVAPAALSSGSYLAWDYEAPFGESLSYTAKWTGGQLTSNVVSFAPGKAWLRCPGVPGLSVRIELVRNAPEDEEVDDEVIWIEGSQYPIVVTDGTRQAVQTALTVRTDTLEQMTALRAVLALAAPLLISVPPSWRYGFSHRYAAFRKVGRAPFIADYMPNERRVWTLPYIETGRPVGGVQPLWTAERLILAYPTWDAQMTAFPTAGGMALGRPGT